MAGRIASNGYTRMPERVSDEGQKPGANPSKLEQIGVKSPQGSGIQPGYGASYAADPRMANPYADPRAAALAADGSQAARAGSMMSTTPALPKELLDSIVGAALASVLGPQAVGMTATAGTGTGALDAASMGAAVNSATSLAQDPAAAAAAYSEGGQNAAASAQLPSVVTDAIPNAASMLAPAPAASEVQAATTGQATGTATPAPATAGAATGTADAAQQQLSPAAETFVSSLMNVDMAALTQDQLTQLGTGWQAIDVNERAALRQVITTELLQGSLDSLQTMITQGKITQADGQAIATKIQSINQLIQA